MLGIIIVMGTLITQSMVKLLNWKITYLMRFFVFVEAFLYLRTCLKNPGYASKSEIDIDIEAPEDYKTFIL